MASGFIIFPRSFRNDDIWRKGSPVKGGKDYGHAFIDLVCMRNYKDNVIRDNKGNEITRKKNTLYTSKTELGKMWKWNRPQTEDFLSYLVKRKWITISREEFDNTKKGIVIIFTPLFENLYKFTRENRIDTDDIGISFTRESKSDSETGYNEFTRENRINTDVVGISFTRDLQENPENLYKKNQKSFTRENRINTDVVGIPFTRESENLLQENPENFYSLNNKDIAIKEKAIYISLGKFQNVKIKPEDLERIKKAYPDRWNEKLEVLSEYMETHDTKYKNHAYILETWIKRDIENEEKKRRESTNYDTNPNQRSGYTDILFPEEYG